VKDCGSCPPRTSDWSILCPITELVDCECQRESRSAVEWICGC